MNMNKLAVVAVFSLVCVFASSASAQTATQEVNLASADWSVNAPRSLAKKPPPNDAVWKFMNRLWGSESVEAGSGKLCSFRFARLRQSDQLSLVVSYDGGGTADCNMVEIFDKGREGIESYDLGPAYFGSIQDLEGDGSLELVVDTVFASTGRCSVLWPVIYAWTGNGYSDVSLRYRKYYERELRSLKKQIAALDAGAARSETPVSRAPSEETPPSPSEIEGHLGGHWSSGSEAPPQVALEFPPQEEASQEEASQEEASQEEASQEEASQEEAPQASQSASQAAEAALDRGDADCIRAEAAKTERFLGRARDAGMTDAIRSANSDDPQTREFAVHVLTDIATAQASEYLKTLSNDPDPWVARLAKEALAHVKEGPVAPETVRAERIFVPKYTSGPRNK